MTLEVVARNTRRIRLAKKLSRTKLAECSNLSLSAINNIENCKGKPRVNTLLAVSQALDVPLQELFLPVRVLEKVRFRSRASMKSRENLLAEISRRLDDLDYLEEILDERIPSKLRLIRGRASGIHPREAASYCREELGLASPEPVNDICSLLENAGIKLFTVTNSSEAFYGLSVAEEDGGPAIVVNVQERISIERRIFSAAHELGHLLLHLDAYDVDDSAENKDEEREADLFAGHFLMTDEAFRKEWNDAAGLHWVDRVLKVKTIFRVSYKTVIARLLEHKAVDRSVWMKFTIAYKNRFNRNLPFKEEPRGLASEPFGIAPFDFFEDRFSRLVRRAVEEEKISLSRGAEMLRISVDEMRELSANWAAVL
jgi:Zn-dependent peptidase ImmA (M78 family)/DNA-binding XRE family transcriptional regulator